jgi:hypothetical protein
VVKTIPCPALAVVEDVAAVKDTATAAVLMTTVVAVTADEVEAVATSNLVPILVGVT